GEPHARFGGRGGLSLPDPYHRSSQTRGRPVGAHSVSERWWQRAGYGHVAHPCSPGDRAPTHCPQARRGHPVGAHSVSERRWHPISYGHIAHLRSPGDRASTPILPTRCHPVGAQSVSERRWQPAGYGHVAHLCSPGDRAPTPILPNPGPSCGSSLCERTTVAASWLWAHRPPLFALRPGFFTYVGLRCANPTYPISRPPIHNHRNGANDDIGGGIG